jgi:hypothetical protein
MKQSTTKFFVLRLSFVDLRALCGGRFGKMSHYLALPLVASVAHILIKLSSTDTLIPLEEP